MNSTRKLWAGLAILLIASFAVLIWVGSEIHRQQPPMPEQVVGANGETIFTRGNECHHHQHDNEAT